MRKWLSFNLCTMAGYIILSLKMPLPKCLYIFAYSNKSFPLPMPIGAKPMDILDSVER